MDILDLNISCGETVIPGTRAKLYVCCECDIETFPDYVSPVVNPEDAITLDGDIVLKPNKKFAELDIILDSGQIKHELVGTRGSKNYNNTLDFKILKTPVADAWFDRHPNACLIGIVKQKDGTQRVFGAPEIPAFIETATGDGGNTNDSEAAWTAQIKDSTGKIAPIYNGVIDLTPPNPVVPAIASITPNTGTDGDTLSLSGSGFTDSTAVKFGTTNGDNLNVINDTALTVEIPTGLTPGTIAVTVVTPVGTSSAVNITVS